MLISTGGRTLTAEDIAYYQRIVVALKGGLLATTVLPALLCHVRRIAPT